jgi:3-oxoacyl-[acyl-carrier-protein] synthase II
VRPEVVITGLGAVSPLGLGVAALWQGLIEGRSGIGPIRLFDAAEMPVRIAGEVPGYEPGQHFPARELKRYDRFVQLALLAADEAIAGAKLDTLPGRGRIGVAIGSGVGGLATLAEQHEVLQTAGARRVSPFFIPKLIVNIASGHVAMRHDLRGPSGAAATACCTGAHAIVDGYRAIVLGDADVMVVGGAEAAVHPLGIAGFAAMKALSTRNDEPERASRPFDADRDGFVLSEGAGVLVLESEAHARARGAPVLGRLAGYGLSTDAYHLTAPCPDGRGAADAMAAAVRMAGIEPGDVGYINAHGTSTPQNDPIESAAIRTVFGEAAPPVSSTKSMIGHLLGAAGAVEAIVTVETLRRQAAHPTLNLDTPDPDCPLDYVPHVARPIQARYALSSSFAFGGLNVALAFGTADR